MIEGIPPVINGDGSHSRDFTYVDNVVQVNQLSLLTQNPEALNTVYNVAFGENTSLNELYSQLTGFLSEFNPAIAGLKPVFGPARKGDVLHSLASIDKARRLLGYDPKYNLHEGLKEAIQWYYEYLSK